jgi:L-malate glycosyltransferase
MKKNILEICLSPDLGGLELCVLDYFNYFQTQTLAYLCISPGKKLDMHSESENKFRLKHNKFFPFIPAIKLARYIDKKEIDIIHFHWTRDIAIVVLAKLISKKKPKIIQSRHMTMTRFKDDFYHKWLYKNIWMIHAVTQQVKEQLEKFIPKRIIPKVKMVYLGVNEPEVDTVKCEELKKKYGLENNFVVGIIGRIEEGKGQYLVVEAIAKLKEKSIKALIVGSSMSEEYFLSLKKKVQELKVEDRIIFTGFTKDVNEHIQLCDVTVLATPKETFGLVVIESMVNKTPVIATNKGGPLEIIKEGVDGLLFDRTSEDLVRKIELLLSDEGLRDKLASNGYEKVKTKFDKEQQMKKMYEVLNES